MSQPLIAFPPSGWSVLLRAGGESSPELCPGKVIQALDYVPREGVMPTDREDTRRPGYAAQLLQVPDARQMMNGDNTVGTKAKKSRRSHTEESGGVAESLTPQSSGGEGKPRNAYGTVAHEHEHELEAKIENLEAVALGIRGISLNGLLGTAVGAAVIVAPMYISDFATSGLQAISPLLGIMLIVFSLFGDLPHWVSWTQRLGAWLYPGIALGTFALLIPLLLPSDGRESSFWAFSPRVWLAYLFIVLVSLSFEQSSLPTRVYWFFQARALPPTILVPIYMVIAGLLGNVLDGVSIVAISVVIFRRLLSTTWATQASFALLFGGLLSNFLTVAAEPTNIKFQDVLASLLDRVTPSFWLTNWPISLLAIILPALYLGVIMSRARVSWLTEESQIDPSDEPIRRSDRSEFLAGLFAVSLLAAGIIAHSVLQALINTSGGAIDLPLGLFLAPAGIIAFWHLRLARRHVRETRNVHFSIPLRRRPVVHQSRLPATWKHIQFEVPIWMKLAVIFSLLWYISNGLTQATNVFSVFFVLPETLRFGVMSLLSLASSVTDNVALAAMQGSLLLQHPMAVWQIRFLFILLTWAGGFTPFGCLQSLALNSRLQISTGTWFKLALPWGFISIIGAIVGLALIGVFHPGAVGLPR